MVPGKTNATQFATLPSPHRASHVSSRVIKSFQYTKRPAASSGRQHACGHQRCWSSTSASFPGNPADSPCRSPGRRLNTVLVSSARWPPRWGRFGRHLLGRSALDGLHTGHAAGDSRHSPGRLARYRAPVAHLQLRRLTAHVGVCPSGTWGPGGVFRSGGHPGAAGVPPVSADISSSRTPQWRSAKDIAHLNLFFSRADAGPSGSRSGHGQARRDHDVTLSSGQEIYGARSSWRSAIYPVTAGPSCLPPGSTGISSPRRRV